MAVIASDDELFNAELGELSDSSRDVADDAVHHLPGGELVPRLAKSVDLLRPDYY